MRNTPVDLVVLNGSDPLLAGTGLKTGEHIPRVAGWEADRIADNGATPPDLRVLFEGSYVPMGDTMATAVLQATVYTWPASGAMVYASGEPGFAWALSTYNRYTERPAMGRFLRNVLDAFVAARGRQ